MRTVSCEINLEMSLEKSQQHPDRADVRQSRRRIRRSHASDGVQAPDWMAGPSSTSNRFRYGRHFAHGRPWKSS